MLVDPIADLLAMLANRSGVGDFKASVHHMK
jgi:hypothetical protein